MISLNKKESFILFLGDLIVWFLSIWIMLLIRHFEFPNYEKLIDHIIPFSILFLVWLFIFYSAGLYEKQTLLLKNNLPKILLNTQVINIVVAIIFFYFIPYFGITPKINLFIYLIISFILIALWRTRIFNSLKPSNKHNAILIGEGNDIYEIKDEINNNPRYNFKLINSFDIGKGFSEDVQEGLIKEIYENNVSLLILEVKNKNLENFLSKLFNLIFADVQFVDKYKIYETLFDRVSLTTMNHTWFLENISSKNHVIYDYSKRIMDIIISLLIGIPSLILYPFVIIAIFLEDRKNPFIVQERIGQNNKKIHLYKFRTMKVNDGGVWPTEEDSRITKVGKFLRKSRIDELPQLFNVLKGEISLVGPRPDIVDLYNDLKNEIPYYNIRNLVKPGLSGWAQTHQEIPPHTLEETKIRLTYDLFYIKNRSFFLDLKIALQTLKTLVSRTGR